MIAAQRLEGGQRDHDDTTGSDDPGHLSDGGNVTLDTLQDVERRRDIKRSGRQRNTRDITANHRCPASAGAHEPGRAEIETDGRSVRTQQLQVVSSATSAVDQAQPSPALRNVGDHRCDEFAEASKPEMGRFGATRQLEQVVH